MDSKKGSIRKLFFDKLGRLNSRRVNSIQIEHPHLYNDILEFTKDFKYPEEYTKNIFRYQFLTWFYNYKREDLICRVINCTRSVKWSHHIPNKVCGNSCRILDGSNIRQEIIKTNQRKYGVNSTSQLDTVQKKFKKTLLKNNHILHKNHYYDRDFITKTFFDKDQKFDYKLFCKYFGVIQPTAHNHIKKLKINYKRTMSCGEKEIQFFIRKLSEKIVRVHNTRKIIAPKELDIYLPEYNLAIEYNGLYWHSYGTDDKLYKTEYDSSYQKTRHIVKTLLCNKKSITLLNIYENEWADPNLRCIWQSMIRYKLGFIVDKRDARKLKTVIYKRSSDNIRKFLIKNHLQGIGENPDYIFALIDPNNGEILQVMTFRKTGGVPAQYEIIRLATKTNVLVRGGSSKLLKAFEVQLKPNNLKTKVNLRFSNGDIYEKLGFTFIRRTPPNFEVFKKNTLVLEPREKFQKHKLKNIIPKFNSKLSTIDNIINNGYRIIWDCGNLLYEKEYKW